jgi:hypothetical protein
MHLVANTTFYQGLTNSVKAIFKVCKCLVFAFAIPAIYVIGKFLTEL